MLNEWNFGLKQRFNIKCVIDVVTFVFACVLFLFFAKINGVSPYETFIFLTVQIFALLRTGFVCGPNASVVSGTPPVSSGVPSQSYKSGYILP